jgi:hypothetical protein
MSLDRLIKILKTGTAYTRGTWVLVMGGQGEGLAAIKDRLAQLSITVCNAENLEQAIALINQNDMPPLLAYMYAEGLGGLERTISIHADLQKQTHIGKCLIVSPEANPDIDFSQMDENSPLILSAPKRSRLN